MERGQSLALVALMMPPLIGGLGMGIDYGRLVVEQRKLQNAADAAALAAAPNLPGCGSQWTQATTDATSYLTKNGYTSGSNGAQSPTFTSSQTQVACDTISVSLGRTVQFDFLPFLGMTSKKVTATAQVQDPTGDITTCDTSATNGACFPYIVWNTHGTSCTANAVGDIVLFHDNGFAGSTGATSCGWTGNSNNQKGFLRPDSPLTLGDNTTKGGNACGQEPDAQLQTIAASSNPVIWLPVVDQESGNGSNIDIHVLGFVALSLSFTYPNSDTLYSVSYPHAGAASQPSDYSCPASFFGKIVGTVTTVPTGGTETSGACTASSHASCVQQLKLSK